MKRQNQPSAILGLIFLIILPIWVSGQADEDNCSLAFSIPEVALLDIEPSGLSNITLTLTTNPESGLPVSATGALNENLWINYTSCIATNGNNRSVTAHVSSGTIPSGVTLSLFSDAYAGTGGQGNFGTPAGTISLSSTPKTLISNIGRCYTGDGQNKGHKLHYSLGISDFQALRHNQSSTIQIVFTLSE